jgi:HPt (histidine-containing phosphotransfer) domain-containing protein
MIIVDENLKDPVDIKFLRSITDHDTEFEKDLLEIFIVGSEKDIRKMEESLNYPESNDWYLCSHSFKGSSASIGAFPLAQSLEYAQFNKDASKEDKLKTLEDIKQKFKTTVDFLKKVFNE